MSPLAIMKWLVEFAQTPAGQAIVAAGDQIIHELYSWLLRQQPQTLAECESHALSFKASRKL